MPRSTLKLAEGYKFAVLALPRLNAVVAASPLTIAEEGFALASPFPVEDFEHWRKTVGSTRYENVVRAEHFLTVYGPSHEPEDLNEENVALARQLHRFHLGLLISCPFISHDESAFLEGAQRNGHTQIRGTTTYPSIVRLNNGPAPYLRAQELRHALAVGRSTHALQLSAGGKRFGRILTAYRTALTERSLDVRLHQFVRCIEGFLGTFADRGGRFVAGITRDDLLEMYRIRSAVEHLSGWKAVINARGDPAKELILVTRSLQSQALAQFIICRFMDVPALWPHYATDADVKRSVSALSHDRDALPWGSPMDATQGVSRVDFAAVRTGLDKPR